MRYRKASIMPNDAAETTMMELEQPRGAAQVGAGLREVRERLGWHLEDVAEELRIRLPYLEAIERGELSALPGPAYQTGFVRSYARILGLDPDEILRRFRTEGLGVPAKAQLSFLAPVPDRGVPTGALVFLGVVLVLVGYGLWYRHTEHERAQAQAVPSVPAELAPLAVPPKLPAEKPSPNVRTSNTVGFNVVPASPAPANTVAAATPSSGAGATAGGNDTPNQAAGVAMASAAQPSPSPDSQPVTAAASNSGAATGSNRSDTAVSAGGTQAAANPTSSAGGAPDAGTPAAIPPNGKSIVATANTWVEVRDATGNILFSRVLHAGESWPVPDEAGLKMTAGNAGGTEIAVNGQPGAPLGAPGAVLHGYPLTAPAPGAPAPGAPAPGVPTPGVPTPGASASGAAATK
jgi:cytoskeleton protein RodZ